jgi:hypothetical protein
VVGIANVLRWIGEFWLWMVSFRLGGVGPIEKKNGNGKKKWKKKAPKMASGIWGGFARRHRAVASTTHPSDKKKQMKNEKRKRKK